MRYSEAQEVRARELGANVLDPKGKGQQYGWGIMVLDPGEGRDAVYGIELTDNKGEVSRHLVELYRPERIYVCDCTAAYYGRPCKHVGVALIQHDAELAQAGQAGYDAAYGEPRGTDTVLICEHCHADYHPSEGSARLCGLCEAKGVKLPLPSPNARWALVAGRTGVAVRGLEPEPVELVGLPDDRKPISIWK